MAVLQEQIGARDDEITRLGALLECERGHDLAEIDANGIVKESRKNRVDHLESQLEYLNDTIATLEKKNESLEREKAELHAESQEKLSILSAELKEMYDKNETLCSDLKQLEQMVSDLSGMKRPNFVRTAVAKEVKKSVPLKPSKVSVSYNYAFEFVFKY
jgi:TolA-binding protein